MWYRAEGQGRPIVILHGWTMDHRDEVRTFEPIFAERAGWRRLYPDLPGMGRTPASSSIVTLDDMLDVVVDWIHAELGNERFLLAGTSAGGYFALGVIARIGDSVDGLLLRAPLVVAEDHQRDRDGVAPVISNQKLMASLPPTEREIVGTPLVQTPAYIAALQMKMRESVLPANAAADAAFLNSIREDPSRYCFNREENRLDGVCGRPSLIVTGRHDADVGYRDAFRLLPHFPRATFVTLDRAEHGVPIDQQDLFLALVRDWLARVEES